MLEAGNAGTSPRDYPEPHMRREVRDKQAMLANIDAADMQVIDARDAARFAGEEGSGSEGHIPGAANVPFGMLLKEDGTCRPAGEIRATFEAAGVDLDTAERQLALFDPSHSLSESLALIQPAQAGIMLDASRREAWG